MEELFDDDVSSSVSNCMLVVKQSLNSLFSTLKWHCYNYDILINLILITRLFRVYLTLLYH